MGLDFSSPICLAAGLDKNGVAIAPLARLGFGAVEIGTVTSEPQSGSPKPRLFRLDEDDALINRMGFPSDGLDKAIPRLRKALPELKRLGVRLGVNIGPGTLDDEDKRLEDAVRLYRGVADHCDCIVLNLSSPNAPGLRDLQRRPALDALTAALRAESDERRIRKLPLPPLLLKISPDIDDETLEGLCDAALAHAFDGLIVGNTTTHRPESLRSSSKTEKGGLSGEPLKTRADHLLSRLYRMTEGEVTLIGVGGIANGADAYRRIRLGASLIQFYTALSFHGFGLVATMQRELADLLERDGFASPADAVGVDTPYRPKERPKGRDRRSPAAA